MRRANALSAAALKYGGEHIEAGMTTWELDKLIYDFIVKHGGIPNFKGLYGFPGTACISLNDTVIHGIPSHDIVIRPGDIVSIDTGAKVDGFNGDNACTYAVGKVDLEAQRLLEQRDPKKYVQTLDFKPDWVSCEYHTAYQQPSMVQKLHDLGIKAAYWTVDGEQAVKDLWPLQPDAIVTNRPDRVREWISELEMTE